MELDAQGMKDLSFEMAKTIDKAIIILGSRKTGKPLLSCYISKSLVAEQSKDAGKIIKVLGEYIQGGGGGQPFFATAGGKNNEGIAKALEAFMDRKYVHNLKSILVTRVRKITDNYVFSFLENSQLERQLLQDILQ